MRKSQKQDILEFIESLYEAQEEIKNMLDRKNLAAVQKMLGEYQEFVSALGESIERFEGDGQVTVSYIREYCEILYQIFEMAVNNDVNENAVYKIMRKNLIKIKNSVKNDIPVRKEVVFFPYKASMWDSLESVYLAALEDPDCDAYCVPIPYYDLNPDGTFGKMHYEGAEYPQNIKVTNYQTYNLEERKPDAIYIHNPYDGWNTVTSVHPGFYSSNLKKYTEKLVYIPYFVFGEIKPDDFETIEKMKHFCFLPGIIYADRVILQSENIRRIYISEYRKAAKANGMPEAFVNKKYLEEKFLGTGSPKFDRVMAVSRDGAKVPERWKKCLQKPDGSKKKVVMYNNSVVALLKNEDRMLQKLEQIFSLFKSRQNEVTLLWRPHPLIQSTVQAMRPKLWERYEALVNRYLEEDFGIYDDTADVERAMVLSDAYYGDWSSLVQLYEKTGKPVLIVDYEKQSKAAEDVTGMGADRSLRYCNFVTFEGRDWFWDINYGALFFRETYSNKVKKVGKFQKEKPDAYNNVILFDRKLVVMPCRARKIMIYEIDAKEFRFIDAEIPDISEEKNLFYGYAIVGENVFMVGNQIPFVLKFNMRTEKVEKTVKLIPEEKREIYFRDTVLDNNELIVPAAYDALIFEIDIETLQWKSRKIGQSKSGFSTVCKDKNSIWLFPKDRGAVLQWDRRSDAIREYEIKEAGFRYTPLKPNFHSCCYLDNRIWMFPLYGSTVLFFDLKTGLISKDNAVNQYLEALSLSCDECKFRAVQAVSGNIRLLCQSTGELISYYPEEDRLEICERGNILSKEDYLEWLYEKKIIQILKEGEFTAEEFADFFISLPDEAQETQMQETDNCGVKIYKEVSSICL